MNYCGWQRQPENITVQEVLETAFSKILRKEIAITGCGRTDTGVHASQYFAHFDFDQAFPPDFINRINKFLPRDIVIKRIVEVSSEAHARFDAVQRSYEYHLSFYKNPFHINTIYHYPFADRLNLDLMQQAASSLLNYQAFLPFCKSKSDAKTMFCDLRRAAWRLSDSNDSLIFYISSDRFLRGMVRLIVGMCLNVGLGKLSLEALQMAMERQVRLEKNFSVPPKGLYLTAIKYSFL